MVASTSSPVIHDRCGIAVMASRPDGEYQVQRRRLILCVFQLSSTETQDVSGMRMTGCCIQQADTWTA